MRLAIATAIAFACTVAVLAARGGDGGGPRPTRSTFDAARPDAGTDARVARLQRAVRGGDRDSAAALAAAYQQKARETGDPAFFVRAEGVLRRAPAGSAALTQSATLAAARHRFRGALRLARRAGAAAPRSLAPLPVRVDALVELGRYRAARRALQRMVDLKPNLPAYARVSYLRELHGDLPGAASALVRAIAAGGPAPENVAYVQTLLGNLQITRGRPRAAGRAFAAAAAAVPGYAPAAAGRARLAAYRGDLPAAIRRWRRLVTRLPLPEHVIALGEAELAAGRRAAARRDLALVPVQQRLLAAAGVVTDAELAVFEADHGDPARALRLARRAWTAAPSIRSADAVGWALTRSGRPRAGLRWAHRALRLGTLDPLLRDHAGVAALAAGRPAEGRRQLRIARAHGLAAHPWQARR